MKRGKKFLLVIERPEENGLLRVVLAIEGKAVDARAAVPSVDRAWLDAHEIATKKALEIGW